MPDLIDHLAELTGQRDRDVLDVTLVGALRELLGGSTVSVSMYRCVGDPGNERWLTRARLVGAEAVAQADPAWSDLEELPPVVAVPARLSVLIDARTLAEASAGGNWLTRFPVVTDREVIGVLEVETASALDTRQQRTVASILRMFRNFQALLDSSERDTLTGLLNRKTFDESFLKATAVPAPSRA